jgi:hypothetical protein
MRSDAQRAKRGAVKRLPRVLRPGPDRIEAGLAPGGLVAHWYDADGQLLLVRKLPANSAGPIEIWGQVDLSRVFTAADDDVCLVIYDGDDGHRFSAGLR